MAATASFPWPWVGAGTELRLLFENAPVGMAQCDRQGTILAMNPALSAMLAGQLQAGEHLRFSDLVSPPDRDPNGGMFRQLMSGERASFQVENRLSRSDGAATWLRWTAWGVCGGAHNSDCVLLLAEDVTKIRNQEQAARQAERLQALGRMAGSIAHDFNNLLTGILLYCDLMLTGLSAPGPMASGSTSGGLNTEDLGAEGEASGRGRAHGRLRECVQEIRSAAMQATGVVQQLIGVARPRNSRPHALSLNSIAEEMRNLLLRLIGENIELSFRLDPGLGLVEMDPAQAQQVLLNLVLNARDALPEGGRIQVETGNCRVQIFPDGACGVPHGGCAGRNAQPVTSLADDLRAGNWAAIPCVLFVVRDNGGGMNEEIRQRIFQPYFTTKDEGRGSGLGLATVHDIVASRGGLVQVESAPGGGTRVVVLLPAVNTPPPTEPAEHNLKPET